MHIEKIFKQHKTTLSFEFFPPKSKKAFDDLFETIQDLTPLDPSYVSVTYGAGGSTRDLTHDLVLRIQQQSNLTVISHLTCIGSTKDDIYNIRQGNIIQQLLKGVMVPFFVPGFLVFLGKNNGS